MNYQYENEESIDQNLKCGICTYPFICPVETSCHHSFCSQCINQWLDASKLICPICRKRVTKQNIKQITVVSFFSMLDQLLVKCQLCEESRIERGNYQDHQTKNCPKAHVYCKANYSGCQWTGLREELSLHFETCTFKSEEDTFRNEKLVNVVRSFENILLPSDDHSWGGIFSRYENLDGTITMSLDRGISIQLQDNIVQTAIDLITNNICQTLELCNYLISSEDLSRIAMTLTNDRSTTNLNFSRCRINDRGVKSFVDSLPVQSCLKDLNFDGNSITDTGMSSICDLLRTNSSLNRLVLTRNQIGNEGVRMLANLFYYHVISLKELWIGSNYLITNQCFSSIFTLIRWHRNLTLLKIEDTKISYYLLSTIEIFHKYSFHSNLKLIL